MTAILQIILTISFLTVSMAQTYGIRTVVAGQNRKASNVLLNGFRVCPPSQGISFECLAPPNVNQVTIAVNGKQKIEYNRRFLAAGNAGNNIFPLRPTPSGDVIVKCFGNNFFTEVKGKFMCSAPTSAPGSAPTNCVTVRGIDYVGELKPSSGWEPTGGTGVTYQPRNNNKAIVPPEHSVLAYKFKVPKAAKYAIIVDMRTRGSTDYNDIWLKCDGYFRLWKNGETKLSKDSFIKVYHNRNGRAKEGVTIDNEGWSISTRNVYVPGNTYTCYVGARSTKTTLYGIIGFPCNGNQCERTSAYWKSSLNKCNIAYV